MEKETTVNGERFVLCEGHKVYHRVDLKCPACTLEQIIQTAPEDSGRFSRMDEMADIFCTAGSIAKNQKMGGENV